MQNVKTNRITALIAIVAVLFVMLFSTIYISQHKQHDCTGAECPICAVMDMCANNIRNIGMVVISVAASFCLYLSLQQKVHRENRVSLCCSLVSQKVRMNN